ncbi:MAG TPA: asparagine synthase (glutamine-hydrolyzing) [Chitinophagaceae bacterium]
MCGICAIVNTKDQHADTALIGKMNARIAHRGPDNDGVYSAGNFALGHRRLSILDTGHLAHQPLQYRDYIITFNGEVYNHLEIKEALEAKGYEFCTRCDTEVIVAAYDYWGPDCASKFEGMWAFVIYDPRKNILFGSRDRFGQKPFYYGRFGNYFTIASEIKQFMEIPGFKAVLNQEVAFNFLNYGALNYSDDTFFEGVQSLTAGHNLTYNLSTHSHSISKYYEFPHSLSSKMDLVEAADEFRKLFTTSVSSRLSSDVRIGSCLSGGLDSSSIVCMVNDLLEGKEDVHTLSICWNHATIDEREFIDEVSNNTRSVNTKIFPDMMELNDEDVLGKIIYHQDQPIPSASHFSEYKVYEAAGQMGFPVMLDGQGADEYLGGYGIFNWYHLHGLLSGYQFGSLKQEWSAVQKSSKFSSNAMLKNFLFIKFKHRRPQMDPFVQPGWGREFLNGNPTLPPHDTTLSAKELSYHQLFSCSLPYQLHSADRNSMCHSVESRLPFLDHRLVEFCYSLPDTFKIANGVSKVILREGLKSILPQKIRERKLKLGFPAPEREWLQSNVKWVNKELETESDTLHKFVNSRKLKDNFMQFSRHNHQDHAPFFRSLAFAKWLKIFNVSFVQLALICL